MAKSPPAWDWTVVQDDDSQPSAPPSGTVPPAAAGGWRLLFTPAALPRFALVCLGSWLTAADTLVTATMMPTIARDISGTAWFGWSVAGFVLGSIVAGATSGYVAGRIGLKRALMLGGLVYAAGCGLSALSPNILVFLAGRTVQGIGGGWTAGLCYVAVTALFAETLWPRVLSALAGVWGFSTLSSPLIGGLFAEHDFWRGGFWFFAVQGAAFIAAAAALVPDRAAEDDPDTPIPWRQMITLICAIAAISAAGVTRSLSTTGALVAGGLGLMALFLRLDAQSEHRLLPRRTADMGSAEGAGLIMLFAFTAATANFTVYGPAMMQALHHASPVLAGYVLVSEAVAWTLVSMSLSNLTGERARTPIRIGAVLITLGLASLAWAAPFGSLAMISAAAFMQGAGFGSLWALATSRIAGAAPIEERALASSAVPTTQLIGTATGAALSALIANLSHFDLGITPDRAAAGGPWLFGAFLPLAGLGIFAAWRLSDRRFAPG